MGSSAAEQLGSMERLGMASNAIGLQDALTLGAHENRLIKILQGKSLRVPPTVSRLSKKIVWKLLRQGTADTRSHRVMGGFLPRIVLRLHDVTVGACPWVGAQVRQAFGVAEGGETNANGYANSEHGC